MVRHCEHIYEIYLAGRLERRNCSVANSLYNDELLIRCMMK